MNIGLLRPILKRIFKIMQSDLKGKFIPGITRIKYGGAVIDQAEKKAIKGVLDRNWWTLDEQGRLFEKELANSRKVKYSVYTNSGSSALLLAMGVLDFSAGSEIIIPAVNFPTVVQAVLVWGYKPVFVDVNLSNLCLDLSKIEQAITPKTKAIVLVNIAGNTVDISSFVKIAKKHNLATILDNCDGFGTTYKGAPIESFFDFSATSFHAAHIITTGEGGAMFTNKEDAYRKAKSIREWGRADDSDFSKLSKNSMLPIDYPARYTYPNLGFNLKPIELQAAMGRAQLKKIEKIKKARAKVFDLIYKGLHEAGLDKYLFLPTWPEGASISWFAFPITLKKDGVRPKLREFLEKKNIETRVIFAGNITKQQGFKGVGRTSGSLKNADTVCENSFFVSAHPTVTKEMIDYVVNSFKEFFL